LVAFPQREGEAAADVAIIVLQERDGVRIDRVFVESRRCRGVTDRKTRIAGGDGFDHGSGEFVDRFKHRHHVLRRDFGQDVVNVLNTKPPPGMRISSRRLKPSSVRSGSNAWIEPHATPRQTTANRSKTVMAQSSWLTADFTWSSGSLSLFLSE